jgi:dCTP deaminase
MLIFPFHERSVAHGMTYGLGPAGYDVRIAQSLTLAPGSSTLASTIERFQMPPDLLGRVADKSTWARRFLTVQNTIIEPGWCGYLTLELSNHSDRCISIMIGMPIAQIIFDVLDQPTEIPYRGKYQHQESGPIAARLDE